MTRRLGLAVAAALVLPAAACGGRATDVSGAPRTARGRGAMSTEGAAVRPDLPGREPALLLREWLDAFDAADRARLTVFHKRHVSEPVRGGSSPEELALDDIDLRAVGGRFELHRIRTSTATEVRAILRRRDGLGWAEISFAVDPAQPDMITSIDMHDVPTPEAERPPREDQAALAADMDRLLARLAGEDRFSGVVLMARNGAPFFEKAIGYADREQKTPIGMDTMFNIASMNKMFTSVAIARLVQQGKLAYSDTVAVLLPDYPDKQIAAKITVHHLLTHTSGLGDFFGPELDSNEEPLRELRQYLPFFAGKPLRFEPGAGWSYSNAGMLVAGLIVERRSGRSYFDYVRRHVYRPARMTRSDHHDRLQPDQAVGYTRRGGLWVRQQPRPRPGRTIDRGTSAGGGQSTARDLLAFDRALRTHKLVNPALTAEITTGKVATTRGDSKYAYGFAESLVDGKRVIGHTGGYPGTNVALDMYWDSGYTVIVLANLDPPIANRIRDYIRERIRQ